MFHERRVWCGYELNCPVIIRQGFVDEKSFLSVSEKNIIIDTVKFAEDGSGDMIIRMYESGNTSTSCVLKLGFEIKAAYITNMLEENKVEANLNNNEILLVFKPFEVVTIRVKGSE